MTRLKRGFAAMPPSKRSAAGRKGGKRGKGHKFTPADAAEAGRKGGRAGAGIQRGDDGKTV